MSVVVVDVEVTKMWRDPDGKFHRVDGPAMEWADGSKFWYLHDKLHRVDAPAVKYANGSKYWYLNGKMHRADGPAVERHDGTKKWYFEDHEITKAQSEFIQRMHKKAFHHNFKILRYWMIKRLYDPKRKSGEKRAADSWDDTRELYAKRQK